jgi:DNA repair exonuclease SbcCD ATPase subunit
MQSHPQLRDHLRGRSTSATLNELMAQGRSSVRVLRPEAIEMLIQEGMERAGREQGLIPAGKVEELVENGRAELRLVVRARDVELAAMREQLAELEDLKALVEKQRDEIEFLREKRQSAPGSAQEPAMMAHLLEEMSALKQSMERAGSAAPQGAPTGAIEAALAQKLDGIADGLNAKLDRMRRGAGGSSGAEDVEANLDGLFAMDTGPELETNIEDVGVKNRDGKGIGSNLDRIRKLRGDK